MKNNWMHAVVVFSEGNSLEWNVDNKSKELSHLLVCLHDNMSLCLYQLASLVNLLIYLVYVITSLCLSIGKFS